MSGGLDFDNDLDDVFQQNDEYVEDTHHQPIAESFSQQHSGSTHFEQVLTKLKGRNRKSDGALPPEAAALFAKQFVDMMNNAAEEDEICIAQGKPPTAKLQILDNVCAGLTNKRLTDALMTSECGAAINRWLAVDSRGQLAPLTIRSKLVDAIETINIGHDLATTSYLGKTMLALWSRETDKVVRQKCANLCLSWLNSVFAENPEHRGNKFGNTSAVAMSAAVRKEMDNTKDRRTYAAAPSRTYLKAPESEYKGDAAASLNLKISKKMRDMRRK
eukprot:GDKJ01018365.1.p1 GENE.GDKJ01018365.1~~GDKJ01018365.1.p1  ORF type:complete len:274 (-),score=64.94 GDKJ01018365.1:50-871(-)